MTTKCTQQEKFTDSKYEQGHLTTVVESYGKAAWSRTLITCSAGIRDQGNYRSRTATSSWLLPPRKLRTRAATDILACWYLSFSHTRTHIHIHICTQGFQKRICSLVSFLILYLSEKYYYRIFSQVTVNKISTLLKGWTGTIKVVGCITLSVLFLWPVQKTFYCTLYSLYSG